MASHQPHVTLIHTVGPLAEQFRSLVLDRIPEARIDDVVMEELLQRTIADGYLSDRTIADLRAAVEEADEQTDVVLVTCSSLGPAVDGLAGHVPPVLRVDEPMAREAVRIGGRIGVLATLDTTMHPTCSLLERVADAADKHVELVPRACREAFDAVRSGDTERHDRLVRDALEATFADGVDVVVLAQASMARVVETLSEPPPVPVLSSPASSADHLAELLQA